MFRRRLALRNRGNFKKIFTVNLAFVRTLHEIEEREAIYVRMWPSLVKKYKVADIDLPLFVKDFGIPQWTEKTVAFLK